MDPDNDACSWLAGWANLAARKDAIPQDVLQRLDQLAYGGSPACARASTGATHNSLPAPSSAAWPAARSHSSPSLPRGVGRKRKTLDLPAATEQYGWAAKLARSGAQVAAVASAGTTPQLAPPAQQASVWRDAVAGLRPDLVAMLALLCS
ncbi:hypothetical protein ABPG77_010257 [Micractinium sp. CCAP 211/92]